MIQAHQPFFVVFNWKSLPIVYLKVAGIDSDSGALIWRHAQEAEDIGAVRALKVRVFKRLSFFFSKPLFDN